MKVQPEIDETDNKRGTPTYQRGPIGKDHMILLAVLVFLLLGAAYLIRDVV